MSDYLDPTNKELLKDFFDEAELQVELLEQNILLLENDPSNRDAIDEIFRAAHTLKGGSATVEMQEITQLTHLIENVLDEMRSETLKAGEYVVDILLKSIDIIKQMLRERLAGRIFEEDISALEDELNALLGEGGEKDKQKKKKEKKARPKEKKSHKEPSYQESDLTEYELLELRQSTGEGETLYQITVQFDKDAVMNTVGGIQVYAALKEIGTVIKTNPEFEQLYSDRFFPYVEYYISTKAGANQLEYICDMPDIIKSVRIIKLKETASTDEEMNESGEGSLTGGEEKAKASEAKTKLSDIRKITKFSSVLRVESNRIDALMNLVSEAVITKATFNQISSDYNNLLLDLQEATGRINARIKEFFKSLPEYMEAYKSNGKDLKAVTREVMNRFDNLPSDYIAFESALKNTIGQFHTTAQSLGRITNELQEGVMKIRMVPVEQIFSRFPRLVRDLSRDLNKNVKLKTEGEETELDKSVIEDLIDPLIHCVRNSLDHGIESEQERIKQGKPPEGTILLKAMNEGNMIIIEIYDDGRGIDVDDIRKKAVKLDLIHPDKHLSDIEAFNLIFQPGFSTAEKVTDVSGRGVGLDVVKKKIEKLNGNVSVWSKIGVGTKFTIKLPLTLAIIQGLMVRVGGEVYAVPITSVIESHRIKPEEIKLIDNYEVFNLREEVISIVRLNRIFKIQTDETKPHYYLVLVGSENNKVGLMVDSLIGEEDIVIKPLKDKYSNSPGIAGATILGDGTVSLIIDVSQLLDLDVQIEKTKRKEREAKIL
ncbi:MAG: chemotaxis protein CheA [Spirochaetales bacterium]|nr:chemotaxis protein CheA [Spirochaetales bacterium]